MKVAVFIAVSVLLLAACNHSQSVLVKNSGFNLEQVTADPAQLEAALADMEKESKAKQESKELGRYVFSIRHLPALMIVKSNYPEVQDKAGLDSLLKEYEGFEFYRLQFRIRDFAGEPLKSTLTDDGLHYEDKVKFYAFRFQQGISLVCGKDTLPCATFHFERDYGLSSELSFLLGFENKDKSFNKNRYLSFSDNDVFEFGKVNMKIN